MPVLVIAVVFFLIFLVMGVMGFTAVAVEHKGHLFSWHWLGSRPLWLSPTLPASVDRDSNAVHTCASCNFCSAFYQLKFDRDPAAALVANSSPVFTSPAPK